MPASVLTDIELPPTARKIVSALVSVYPRSVSRSWLVNEVYAFNPTGGPEQAENVISVTINRAKPKLAPFGWSISDSRRPGGIRLVRARTTKVVKKPLTAGAENSLTP